MAFLSVGAAESYDERRFLARISWSFFCGGGRLGWRGLGRGGFGALKPGENFWGEGLEVDLGAVRALGILIEIKEKAVGFVTRWEGEVAVLSIEEGGVDGGLVEVGGCRVGGVEEFPGVLESFLGAFFGAFTVEGEEKDAEGAGLTKVLAEGAGEGGAGDEAVLVRWGGLGDLLADALFPDGAVGVV